MIENAKEKILVAYKYIEKEGLSPEEAHDVLKD